MFESHRYVRPGASRLAVLAMVIAALAAFVGLVRPAAGATDEVTVVSRFSMASEVLGPNVPVGGVTESGASVQWVESYAGTELRAVDISADVAGLEGFDAKYTLELNFPTERRVRIQGSVATAGDPEGCGSCAPSVLIARHPFPSPYVYDFFVVACVQGPNCQSSKTFDTTLLLRGTYHLNVAALRPTDHANVTLTVDGGPSISAGDATAIEGGPAAAGVLQFPLSLSVPAPAGGITVTYGTSDGSAHAGSDYAVASGTATFAEGQQTTDVFVAVVGDLVSEPTETMTLVLSNPSAGATISDASGTGTILDDDSLTFDWTVPDRFGLDANLDSMIDYFTTAAAVSPSQWRVDFTYSVAGSCSPALSPFLTVDGVAVPSGSAAILAINPALCTISYGFPREKTYAVRLELRDSTGAAVASLQRNVTVQDWLIISLGDSVASGEGNPDIPGSPGWENRQCHRSALAGPAQAALAIERADPKTSVTFVHLACSGASVYEGVLARYRGQEGGAWLPPQVDVMDSLVGTREIDAVTLSVGANDVRFSPVVVGCFWQTNCHLATTRNSMLQFFNGWLALLPGNYDALGLTLRQSRYDVDPGRTYVTEYYDALRDQAGNFCDQSILEEGGAIPFGGISAAESQWASTDMMVRLNQSVAAGASRNGWKYVGGIFDAFRTHGYCSTGRWVVQLTESLADQRNIDGTLHPNEIGHAFYAGRLANALTADFYAAGNLDTPRTPR